MTVQSNPVHKSTTATIFKINFAFLNALFCCSIAWLIWPDSLKGYGLGMLSVILWCSGFASLIAALQGIIAVYKRDKAVEEFASIGDKPKSSTLASDDALKNAGMR